MSKQLFNNSILIPKKQQLKAMRAKTVIAKSAKKNLKSPEDSYHALIQMGKDMGEAVVMLRDINGKEGVHIYASDTWLEITGYTKAELLDKSFFDLLSPKDRKASLARHRQKMSGKAVPGHFNLAIIHKDGKEVLIELSSAVNNYENIPTNILYIRDITKQKNLENELKDYQKHLERLVEERTNEVINHMNEHKRTKEQLQFILDSIPAYVFYKDNKGNYLYANEAIRKEWSLCGINLIGRRICDIEGNGKTGFWYKRHSQDMGVIESGKTLIKSIDYINGKWLSTSRMPYKNKKGEVIGLVGLTYDITTLKETEEKINKLLKQELQMKRQLEEEIKNRIYFTRALVHEAKTPLTPLLLVSELLSEGIKEEPWKEYANTIYNSVINLDKRINQLYDIAKGEMGQLRLNKKQIDILPIIKQVGQFMVHQFKSKGQQFFVKLPTQKIYIDADEDRIQEVLMNLLDNSFKYTDTGGIIILRTYFKEGNVVIEVEDTGSGIPLSKQNQIFIPYKRAGNQSGVGGLGLGLSISKILVELHGGRIWYEKQKEKGSAFCFSLPLASQS